MKSHHGLSGNYSGAIDGDNADYHSLSQAEITCSISASISRVGLWQDGKTFRS
jgi:hypothetical protein